MSDRPQLLDQGLEAQGLEDTAASHAEPGPLESLGSGRLDDLPLTYVKGHSGDPDNDRVDQIAVAFSQGRSLDLGQPSRI